VARGIWSIFSWEITIAGKIKYIEEQQQHHKKASFREEYLQFLKENEIEYDERFLFKPIE